MILTKICGIRDKETAEYAIKSGVNALGFVFYEKSPRSIRPAEAQAIIETLPPFVTTVGLFVNESLDTIRHIYAQTQLNLIQFHGDELPAFCEQVGLPYIRALRMTPHTDLTAECKAYTHAKAMLLDAAVGGVYGGSGASFDWSMIPHTVEKPIILAGGLTPDNVKTACLTVKPYAVDVSSGVEKTKGIKDPEKISAFLQNVQAANYTLMNQTAHSKNN